MPRSGASIAKPGRSPGVGFIEQLGGRDGRVAPSGRRCSMNSRPVKRDASAASVSLNAPHQPPPVLARQNTKTRATFAFVAARATPQGGRTACDGYLALNPSDFITSSVTSPNSSLSISIYSKPYFLVSCSM